MGLAGLAALRRAGYEIAAVFSHEDDPGERCWFGSVKDWAAARGIPVHCPVDVNEPYWIERIAASGPEMIFSFYYRRMLAEEILRLPPLGAYNLHGSLLPAYRGRCPVNWVLLQGETRTGVTLHHMVRRADAGDIVGQREVTIDPEDTALTLYGKLCAAAGILLDELLPLLKAGKAPRIPQDIGRGSYFGGRKPEDGRIDWRWPAERIYNLVRAVTDPYPGAFGTLPDGSRLLVWRARPLPNAAGQDAPLPGRIEIAGGDVLVGTGQGKLQLIDVETAAERITGEKVTRYFADKEGLVLT
jgi:UDP-4-amino-4-deoxy-L-arabinose formyltransferase/UDP-glucuronic acid dehydrogenase (UDP-4-keto-hexauronic acid decarboxylating)